MKFISFFILILAASCTNLKDVPVETTPKPDIPTIIFVNYEALKTSEEAIEIRLINVIPAEGKLKPGGPQPKNIDSQDLKYIQMTNASARLDSGYISNPLVKDIEYTDSDGNFTKKRIELDSAEFSIRIQKDPRTNFVVIERANQPGIQLFKTDL